MSKNKVSLKQIDNYLCYLAEKSAATPQAGSRWTRDDRVVICLTVLRSLAYGKDKEKNLKKLKRLNNELPNTNKNTS